MKRTTPVPQTPPTRHRFHLLDALRGVAALFVVGWHAPAEFHLRNSAANAYLAVDFFFCLSGFVVAFSYEQRLAAGLSLKDFDFARLIRLYPLYLLGVVLGASFLLLSLALHHKPLAPGGTAVNSLAAAFFVPRFSHDPTGYMFPLNTPSWSLLFELLANIFFAVLVVLRLASTRNLLLVWAACVLLMARWLHHGGTVDVGWSQDPALFYLGGVRVLLSFLLGAVLLHAFRAQNQRQHHHTLQAAASASLALLVALALLAPWTFMQGRWFSLGCVLLIFPAVVYAAAHVRPPSSWTPACILLGELSYPLYLIHVPFLRFMNVPVLQRLCKAHPAGGMAVYLLFLLLLSCLAVFTARLFDTPLRRHLSRWYAAHAASAPLRTEAAV